MKLPPYLLLYSALFIRRVINQRFTYLVADSFYYKGFCSNCVTEIELDRSFVNTLPGGSGTNPRLFLGPIALSF